LFSTFYKGKEEHVLNQNVHANLSVISSTNPLIKEG